MVSSHVSGRYITGNHLSRGYCRSPVPYSRSGDWVSARASLLLPSRLGCFGSPGPCYVRSGALHLPVYLDHLLLELYSRALFLPNSHSPLRRKSTMPKANVTGHFQVLNVRLDTKSFHLLDVGNGGLLLVLEEPLDELSFMSQAHPGK